MVEFDSDIFSIHFDPLIGRFDFCTTDPGLPDLLRGRLKTTYTCQGLLISSLTEGWQVAEQHQETINIPEHGETEMVTFELIPDSRGISHRLQFGILKDHPLVIWKIEVVNRGNEPVFVGEIELLAIDPLHGGSIKWAKANGSRDLHFFSNGWQSWSPSQAYCAESRMNISNLGPLQHPMIYNRSTPIPRRKGISSSDFFAVFGDMAARSGFVLGFLAQKKHFGTITANFNGPARITLTAAGDGARLDPGKTMETDWAVFNPLLLDHRQPLEKFAAAVARENHIKNPGEPRVGWCSWYHFYDRLSAQDVKNNLKVILDQQESLPMQLLQIDDGFETRAGDWFRFKSTFPEGVGTLAQEIRGGGLTPGLWLAPFIVHPKAEIAKLHPDWLLRKENGKPVNAGYVWGTLTHALDLTVPEALAYACRVVRTASREWKFPYLKLDFLYAAALPGRHKDATLTRAEVLRRGLEALRAFVGPEVSLLGCGAPLGSVLGLVEAMRIGADVSEDWNPKFKGIGLFLQNEPSMPCARNSIQNILTRANLHNIWWINDPDCLLLNPEIHLTLAEVRSLASAISLTGGALLISDDLPRIPKERLKIAECLLPLIGERARIMDWMEEGIPSRLRLDLINDTGEWHILAKYNWSNRPKSLPFSSAEFGLPDGIYWTREFWGGSIGILEKNSIVSPGRLPVNGCAVVAARRVEQGNPAYLGSDLHISQGIEVAQWLSSPEEINFTLRLPRNATGNVFLYVPGGIKAVTVHDREVNVNLLRKDIFSVPVQIEGFVFVRAIRNPL